MPWAGGEEGQDRVDRGIIPTAGVLPAVAATATAAAVTVLPWAAVAGLPAYRLLPLWCPL